MSVVRPTSGCRWRSSSRGNDMKIRFGDLIRSSERKADGYSRELQAARIRAAYQRSYFAPALFSLAPAATDLIGSMAVAAHLRLDDDETWLLRHTADQDATLPFREARHLMGD